nr:hypothetical protein [Moraxella sp. CTOTU48717]
MKRISLLFLLASLGLTSISANAINKSEYNDLISCAASSISLVELAAPQRSLSDYQLRNITMNGLGSLMIALTGYPQEQVRNDYKRVKGDLQQKVISQTGAAGGLTSSNFIAMAKTFDTVSMKSCKTTETLAKSLSATFKNLSEEEKKEFKNRSKIASSIVNGK